MSMDEERQQQVEMLRVPMKDDPVPDRSIIRMKVDRIIQSSPDFLNEWAKIGQAIKEASDAGENRVYIDNMKMTLRVADMLVDQLQQRGYSATFEWTGNQRNMRIGW